jgi:hypothetical protein
LELIPWIFEEEPVCKDQGCDSCGIIPIHNGRRLGIASYILDTAPSNWGPANDGTAQSAINWHYDNYVRYQLNPLWSADLSAQGEAYVVDCLSADEKQRIVKSLGNTKDINTAIAAAEAIYSEFSEERDLFLFQHECRTML